jgi:hypothetical protein
MEGCIALESFVVNDGEGTRPRWTKLTKGRLDKTTWSQIDIWPTNLKSFTIEIDESAPHHSWVLHHLASIHHLPFSQFDTFQVKRLVHRTALLPFPPVNASVPKIQKGHEPEAVPPLLLEAIVDGEELKMRVLCLDWWEMGPNELDGLVKGCTGLAKLRVGITFPIVKLVSDVLMNQLPPDDLVLANSVHAFHIIHIIHPSHWSSLSREHRADNRSR